MPLGTTRSIAWGFSRRVSHLGDDVPGVDRQRRTGADRCRPLAQRRDGALPLVVAAGQRVPGRGGAADAHQRAGDEGAAAERGREIVGGDDLGKIESGGDEDELRRAAARHQALDRADRRREARPGTHALVRGRAGAVDGNLHAIDAERGDPVGRDGVDAAAVGLELEGDAAGREPLEDLPGNGRRREARRRRRRRRGCRNRRCRRRGRAPPRDSTHRARPCRGRIPRSTRDSVRRSRWSAARQEKGARRSHRPSAPASHSLQERFR